MKRKALSIFMVTALTVSMLAGCGGSASGSSQTASSESGSAQASASGSEAASGEKTTVNFYYSTDLENTVALQVQSFNESQDEIERCV